LASQESVLAGTFSRSGSPLFSVVVDFRQVDIPDIASVTRETESQIRCMLLEITDTDGKYQVSARFCVDFSNNIDPGR
jgi:hypothetical protein